MCPMRATDYAGRAVIVTGGTRGIGAEIARAFLRAGAQVLICGRTDPGDGAPLPGDGRRAARFTRADVRVDGEVVGAIERGILALIGVRKGDDTAAADRLLERLLSYRIFADEEGRMNRSLREITAGGLLLVPQFTLAADTHKGTRAGFSTAAAPEVARGLFEYLLERAKASQAIVSSGIFGANMQVSLVNDGPVTFWLETSPATP